MSADARALAQLAQDPTLLDPRVREAPRQRVVLLHDGEGLDEEGLSARRLVVDDTPRLPPVPRGDGDDVASAPERDVVGGALGEVESLHQPFQATPERLAERRRLPAKLRQARRCGVEHLAGGADGVGDPALQVARGDQGLAEVAQPRTHGLPVFEGGLHLADDAERAADLGELVGLEDGAPGTGVR